MRIFNYIKENKTNLIILGAVLVASAIFPEIADKFGYAFAILATRTISNGGGNWSSTGTWAEGAVPTASDAVVATGTSGNVTIDTTTCVASTMVLTNYVGTMTFTAGQKLTVTTTVTFVSGMTIAGTGTLQLSANATITSGGKTFTGDIAFDAGTWTLADNWTVSGSIIALSSNQVLNGNTMYVGTNITANALSSCRFTGTTTLVMNGTGSITNADSITNTLSYIENNLTFNTAGTITIGAIVRFGGVVTYTAGTIDTTTNSSVVVNADTGFTLNTSGMTWNNIYFYINNTTCTLTLGSNLVIGGSLIIDPGVAVTTAGSYDITTVNFVLEPGSSYTMVSGRTLTVSTIISCVGVLGSASTIKAVTPSSAFYLVFSGLASAQKISQIIFTDVDASGSAQVVHNWYGGTLTRTTNITNVTSADIGGGGSGGGASFFSVG